MTITDKVNEVVESRAISLSSKTGTLQKISDLENERDLLLPYLYGSTTEEGILSLMAEIASFLSSLEEGVTFSTPNLLGSYETQLTSQMNSAVSSSGDGEFYDDGADQELNTTTTWLTTNGYSSGDFTLSSVYLAVQDLLTSIEAVRTVRETTAGDPLVYTYRDYYNNTADEKTNLKDDLTAVISELDALYSDALSLYTLLDTESSNSLLTDPDISSDYPDVSSFSDMVDSIEAYKTILTAALNFFDPIGPADDCSTNPNYDQEDFDIYIGFDGAVEGTTEIESSLESDLEDLLDLFSVEIIPFLQGALNLPSGSLTTGLRKWYYFWIKLLIEKPQSTLINLTGVNTAYTSILNQLVNAKNNLESLFGTDYEKFLLKPEMIAVFQDEELFIKIIFSSLPCYSKVLVYRDTYTQGNTLSNDASVSSPIIETLMETPTLELTDTDTLVEDTIYLYRVKVQDTSTYRIDTYNTGSDQSDILLDSYAYINIVQSVIDIADHPFSVGDIIYIDSGTYKGVYSITSKTSSSITLGNLKDGEGNLVDYTGSGNIYKTKGVLFF